MSERWARPHSPYFTLDASEADASERMLEIVGWTERVIGRLSDEARRLIREAVGSQGAVQHLGETDDGYGIRVHWVDPAGQRRHATGYGGDPDEAFEHALRALG